jgi:hypothetical protein
VPSALSKEMEEERDEKQKIRRKGLKEKIRERERAVGDAVDATPEPVVTCSHLYSNTSNLITHKAYS